MKIVFFGKNASTFHPGFEALLAAPCEVSVLSDDLGKTGEAEALANADVVIGVRYGADMPGLRAKLFQLPAAGYDAVDMAALPKGCTVCNAFGHENAIAEYVMTALLMRHVPIADADKRLRQGDWKYWAGGPDGLRTELGSQTLGIVGYGHIGKAVADRALAFGMKVQVANRSPVSDPRLFRTWGLGELPKMAAEVDILLNTLPLAESTKGLVNKSVLQAMSPQAIVMNVGRGAVVDEADLFAALSTNQIGGAILDTWYVYPSADDPKPHPAKLPFHDLSNVTMTPHMSGWTEGTVRRRTETCAQNVNRLMAGLPFENIVRQAG